MLPEYEAVAWPADQDVDPSLPSLHGPDLVAFTERILAMSGKEYRRVFTEDPSELVREHSEWALERASF